jgi:Chaperone of endosialidase
MAETTGENHIMKNRNLKPGTSVNRLARLFASSSWIGLLILFLAFTASAKAADRGNENTSDGAFSLYALTTGFENTAVGYDALRFTADGNGNTGAGVAVLHENISGSANTAVGDSALFHNKASGNTAFGYSALSANNNGTGNTATGNSALGTNSSGNNNTATGDSALVNNKTDGNTAIGSRALYFNTIGYENTATGFQALYKNVGGSYPQGDFNTAHGWGGLYSNTSGYSNTASGAGALYYNDSGYNNTANGCVALYYNTTGYDNTVNGVGALYYNKTGYANTANGWSALNTNTAGFNNTAEGFDALFHSTGSNNVAVGANAGLNLTTGSNNIVIGANVSGAAGEANTIRIGKSGTQQKTFVAGVYGKTVASGASVIINSSGQLGTIQSSARYKEAIKPMDKTSEAVLALKPVIFRYKEELDPAKVPQFGLIAEDVEKVNPDLVVRDEEGKVTTVRYDAVNAMLLNEFLKEHRKVQAQGATIAELKKQIETLTAGLEKVSSQLKINNPARKLAADPKSSSLRPNLTITVP